MWECSRELHASESQRSLRYSFKVEGRATEESVLEAAIAGILMDLRNAPGIDAYISSTQIEFLQRETAIMSPEKVICQQRLTWSVLHENDDFTDVIWTDEANFELLERSCNIHVWAGISWKGTTKMCTFSGIMTSDLYVHILELCLLPSVNTLYPHHHRFMQDNHPKYTSGVAETFFR